MEDTLVVWSYYDFMRGVMKSGDNPFYVVSSGAYVSAHPSDKVFGFLGLASPTAQKQVQVDYSEPTKDVYTNCQWFTKVLRDWRSLDPLYFAGLNSHTHSDPMEGLPSWVPDLRSSILESPVWDATLERTLECAGKDLRFEFAKAGSRISFELGRDALGCRVVFAGQTASVLPVERDNFNLTHIYNELAGASGKEDLSMISVLRSVFWALMCGVDRFNAADAARRLESREQAVMPSETSISLGSERFQTVSDIPLMQAVAKLTL